MLDFWIKNWTNIFQYVSVLFNFSHLYDEYKKLFSTEAIDHLDEVPMVIDFEKKELAVQMKDQELVEHHWW